MSTLSEIFINKYGPGQDISFVRAPGRVNLIGEHTDYNDGFVLPIAINRSVDTALRPNGENIIRIASTAVDGCAEIDLDAEITQAPPAWSNYCRGVIAGMLEAGHKLIGCDILMDSDIPHGAGLSSSAALEVATALAVAKVSGVNIKCDMPLAILCQRAEHEFAGTPCGIMDQAVVVMARENSALLLDCRNGAVENIPFGGPDLALLVCDTQVKHELNDGGYALRRSQCEQSAKLLGLASLREAYEQKIDSAALAAKLEGDLLRRSRHVIGEIGRTIEAVAALKDSNYESFGQLMYESHESLRDDYNVSCEELDAIVETARNCKGVFGARMTGGGFGGSAIILCRAESAESVTETVAQNFNAKFGRKCPIFATTAQAGARIIQ